MSAAAAYDRHGRFRGADRDAALNPEAAELIRRVQARLAAMAPSGHRRRCWPTATTQGPATSSTPESTSAVANSPTATP
jgi:hypothetical protein